MELIKSFDGKKNSYLSIFTLSLALSLGVTLRSVGKTVFSMTIGLGVVELIYSIQKVPHRIKS